MKILIFLLIVLLSSCAVTLDEKANVVAKTECPIGYHLEQTGGVVIFAGNEDKTKHSPEFRCIPDSIREKQNNHDISY
jgi:hypothetical protein